MSVIQQSLDNIQTLIFDSHIPAKLRYSSLLKFTCNSKNTNSVKLLVFQDTIFRWYIVANRDGNNYSFKKIWDYNK